ncbi:hypothetical protein ACLB2K_066094 [Fragaria x ananassa]
MNNIPISQPPSIAFRKIALMLALCKLLHDKYSLAAVTNDIFTKEDGEFLVKPGAVLEERICVVETGGCPNATIHEDININLGPLEEISNMYKADTLLCESGGDNLAMNFSRELADYIIYIIDVSGGDKIPRKGGPGITQADLLAFLEGSDDRIFISVGKTTNTVEVTEVIRWSGSGRSESSPAKLPGDKTELLVSVIHLRVMAGGIGHESMWLCYWITYPADKKNSGGILLLVVSLCSSASHLVSLPCELFRLASMRAISPRIHIWKSRNNTIFRSAQSTPTLVAYAATSIGASFHSVNGPAVAPTSKAAEIICWIPPAPNWVKLNYDEFVLSNSGVAGFVIRDSFGVHLVVGAR